MIPEMTTKNNLYLTDFTMSPSIIQSCVIPPCLSTLDLVVTFSVRSFNYGVASHYYFRVWNLTVETYCHLLSEVDLKV